MLKAEQGRADEINTCIGCNQACLDHTFGGKLTSCLVNPRACHETEISDQPVSSPKKIAVVGAGPAGLAFATTAARRGHQVTLFDAASETGGQFNVAKQVPGKEEFYETIRYFNKQIQLTGVKLELGKKVSAEDLQDFDEVALATGITPRLPEIEGIQHAKVLGYLDVLRDKKPVGKSVAIIGAGGIGFDTAEYLCHSGTSASLDPVKFFAEWGVDTEYRHAGGLREAEIEAPARQVFLLQRKTSKVGDGLGKTTGWIHRTGLKNRGVHMIAGVTYRRIDDAGLHITVDGQEQVLPVDNVIICAGQEPNRALQQGLLDAGKTVHLIGGADVAAELDAKRAINQGVRLAAVI
jgi:2,4-dienoyl-CoA reductase (NADPH2)